MSSAPEGSSGRAVPLAKGRGYALRSGPGTRLGCGGDLGQRGSGSDQ